MTSDGSNGWEAIAEGFIRHRVTSAAGATTVGVWARSFSPADSILDLGCGSGIPISRVLLDAGLSVFGVEASPTLAAEFHRNFPTAPIACEPVQESALFTRSFEGVVAWGLMFLLSEADQRTVIAKIAKILKPGGRFLFTAPWQAFAWPDASTGRYSVSLGHDAYARALEIAGLRLVAEHDDESSNHYYEALRP